MDNNQKILKAKGQERGARLAASILHPLASIRRLLSPALDLRSPGSLTVAPFPSDYRKNPYIFLLYDHLKKHEVQVLPKTRFTLLWLLRQRSRVDILHFHWPHFYYSSKYPLLSQIRFLTFYLKFRLALALGYKFVWTVHNLFPHEVKPSRKQAWLRKKLATSSELIVHCEFAGKRVRETWGKKEGIHLIPHGNYIGFYPHSVSREEARRKLGLADDALVYLAFGALRRYKGIPELIHSFQKFHHSVRTRPIPPEAWHGGVGNPMPLLLIAGKPLRRRVQQDIEKSARGKDFVRLHLEYIPDPEVQYFLAASDFIVLPYQNILTSGIAILAMSFGKPIIAPRLGCLPEILQEKTGLLYDPQSPDPLLKALEVSLRLDRHEAGKNSYKLAQRLSWEKIADKHLEVYQLVKRKTTPR